MSKSLKNFITIDVSLFLLALILQFSPGGTSRLELKRLSSGGFTGLFGSTIEIGFHVADVERQDGFQERLDQ